MRILIQILKQIRLEAVNRALLAADPSTENVTDIAMQHGFCHIGRFADAYRYFTSCLQRL